MKAKQIAAALLTGAFENLFGRLFAGAKSAEKNRSRMTPVFRIYSLKSFLNEPMISSLMPPVRALL